MKQINITEIASTYPVHVRKATLTERVEARFSKMTPGFRHAVMAIESHNPNWRKGPNV